MAIHLRGLENPRSVALRTIRAQGPEDSRPGCVGQQASRLPIGR
jgi:hypothetical protein